jgi:phage-related tail fiber protein
MTKARDLGNSVNAGAIPGSRLEDGGVTTAKLNDGSVTAAKLAAGAAVPIGAVFHFASSSAPTGYLKCNGDTLPNGSGTVQGVTANFAALYAVVGSTYGSAGKLPDLRGEFVRGWDDSRGVDTSRSFGSAQSDDFKSHNHTVTDLYNGGGGGQGGGGANTGTTSTTQTTSSEGGTETRPRNIALLACIKY